MINKQFSDFSLKPPENLQVNDPYLVALNKKYHKIQFDSFYSISSDANVSKGFF